MEVLYKAHKMSPSNGEVVRQMCAVLLVECTRVHEEEQRQTCAAAKQGTGNLPISLGRLRNLIESTQRTLDKALELDPNHRMTLEQYAGFAVTFLRDHVLAA